MSNEYYRMLREYYSIDPTLVDGVGNTSFMYYRQYLYELIYSRFIFVDFPMTWDKDYFRQCLFNEGVISICNTDYGVLALRGGVSGINIYEKPTEMIISNPVLGSFTRRIGIDCEPVYFEYFQNGITSMENIVRRYAVLLAQTDASLNTTLINSRVAMTFTSKSDTALKTAKKMYDNVTRGVPALFMLTDKKDDELSTQPYFNNVKNTYVGNDILLTRQSIINDFCTHIGISNANTDKRERLIKDEVNANNEMTRTLINMWLETINDCFDRARQLFPELKVKCELRKMM